MIRQKYFSYAYYTPQPLLCSHMFDLQTHYLFFSNSKLKNYFLKKSKENRNC